MIWTFTQAVLAMPACPIGGFDALQHKTLEDLRFLACHEIDLHDEGEIELKSSERSAIIKYLGGLTASIAMAKKKGGGA